MRLNADYPPVWLGGFLGLAWVVGWLAPHGPPWQTLPGWLLVVTGVTLMGAAALALWRHRTTLDPHGRPGALVSTGAFAISRNPIYLGDALILSGLCLIFDAPLAALILVPGFLGVIAHRFIAAEEARLAAAFPADFAAYRRRTRRWI